MLLLSKIGAVTVSPDYSLPSIFFIVILSYPTEILLSSLIVTTFPYAAVSFYDTSTPSTTFIVVPSTATDNNCFVGLFGSAAIRMPYP